MASKEHIASANSALNLNLMMQSLGPQTASASATGVMRQRNGPAKSSMGNSMAKKMNNQSRGMRASGRPPVSHKTGATTNQFELPQLTYNDKSGDLSHTAMSRLGGQTAAGIQRGE
jgi:hypothetical protein